MLYNFNIRRNTLTASWLDRVERQQSSRILVSWSRAQALESDCPLIPALMLIRCETPAIGLPLKAPSFISKRGTVMEPHILS